MTGEEKRRLLKEQMKAEYKQDLVQRKEFLEKVKQLRETQKLNNALTDMVAGLEDDSDAWIGKLNEASALAEAKVDMALDSALSTYDKLEALAKQAELEKLSAAQLVEQMKREMGLLPPETPATPSPEVPAQEQKPADPADTQSKKRMGDF
ncbi:MAG: hypothetical protein SF053_06485 [Bacteroidia bacterium]|jgi:hypothetical protein|nr:hypothetical protein [Bacteroidia bacterium]